MKIKLLSISLIIFLALAFSAAPTFASTKNHSFEKQDHNYTFTQGKSKSDPDDNNKGPERSFGKSDKPGSIGGVNKADQDGNNGCGNDLDREDDNEGWCGQKPKKDHDKEKCEKTCENDKDHKGDEDKICSKDEDKETEKPKPSTPPVVIAAPKPQVAAAATSVKVLPNTATIDEINYNLYFLLFASLITAGMGLYFLSRKVEAKSNDN